MGPEFYFVGERLLRQPLVRVVFSFIIAAIVSGLVAMAYSETASAMPVAGPEGFRMVTLFLVKLLVGC